MPDTMVQPSTQPAGQLDALVIGAGFAGMYQLHVLRDRMGLSVQVLEAADGVGGTWYWNRYPGARCDSESHCYSYSFSPELEQDWEWSERYPQQPEILRYLNHVADRFDLRRNISFKQRVTSAAYDAAENLWHVTTESGETFSARFLITAVGCLSTANVAKIPGLETFQGKWYHTGQWPHEGVDFTGQRVGVIGTGSTAIQAIPVIAEQAQHLTVFQRTPNYSVPARNGPLSAEFQKYLKENYRELRQKMKETVNGFDAMTGPLLRMNITGRDGRALKDAWDAGPKTYLGLQVPGFPNLFTITGPGSPSVLCNMPVAIEQHADFIADCIAHMRQNGLSTMEATPEATEQWVAKVNEAASITLLPQAKHSWYLGANIPGKPRVFMPYAGGMARYRGICADVAAKGYEGFALSA
jgi:cation diffusion facilitator CzcD-associated flavoprotein CzcO